MYVFFFKEGGGAPESILFCCIREVLEMEQLLFCFFNQTQDWVKEFENVQHCLILGRECRLAEHSRDRELHCFFV